MAGDWLTYSGTTPFWTDSGTGGTITWSASNCTTTTNIKSIKCSYSLADMEEAWYEGAAVRVAEQRELKKGRNYALPDGSSILIDALGNYRIEDKDAKVTYKANRVREFSPHLNASDMVAKFVEYVAGLGVRRDELVGLPLNLFIQWLIVEAAARDNDPLPSDVRPVESLPELRRVIVPKCLACGRFIPRIHARNQFPFCSPAHGQLFVERRSLLRIEHKPAEAIGA